MRPIHLATIDKVRPVVVLTRQGVRPYMTSVTVAIITSKAKGISVEVPVGTVNGLDHASVISCDNIHTIAASDLGKQIGFLLPAQEAALTEAIATAFDLEPW
ncbi:MAG: type II toxin-antitoxin system PemK/MazF family toxin [Actinomycetota bacterium]